MNKKGQLWAIWVFLGIVLFITVLTFISPLKDILSPLLTDSSPDGLNCGTPTDGYRGSCIVIRGAMLWFVLTFMYYIIKGVTNKVREG